MKNSWKNVVLVVVGVIVLGIMAVFMVQSSRNKAITLEQR